MKTHSILRLILHKLCNTGSATASPRNKNELRAFLAGLFVLTLLPMTHVRGNQYPSEFNNYFSVTINAASPYNALDLQLLGLDTDGNNERFKNCVFSYKKDDGTYEDIFQYEFIDNEPTYTYALIPGTADTKGYLDTKWVGYIGDQVYIKLRWFFPAKLAGKKITIRMGGTWIRDYATSSPKTDYNLFYSKDLQLNEYLPATSVGLEAKPDGNYNFSWTNAGGYVNQFELYTDNICSAASKIATVTGTSAAGSNLVKLNGFNKKNTYYVKQLYYVAAPTGFVVNYSKILTAVATHDGYKYPENATATAKLNDQKIEFGITAGNTSATLPSKYYIKRNGTLITPNGITTTSYTDAGVSPLTDYSYLIYTVPDAWTDKTVAMPELSKSISTTTKPSDIQFTNFKLAPFKGTNPYIKISWDNSEWYPVNTVKLYRKNTTTKDWDDVGVANTALYFNDLNDIVENKYYTYKLEIDQWGKKSSIIDSAIVVDQVNITKIAASKNTFGDRINVQWTIDRLNLCDRFEIYRSFAITDANGAESWSKEELVQQFTAQSLLNNWDDRDAAPGTLYKYKIVAIKRTATLIDIKVNASDIGFRTPVGVVTGRITYGAGTAVTGTSLYVSSSSAGDDKLYRSLKFSGDAAQGGTVNLTKAKHGCIADKGFTFQSWLQPLNRKAETSTIFELDKEYSIRMNSDNILVLMGNTLEQVRSYKLGTDITENSYFHLAVAYSADKKLKIFINGALKDSITLTKTFTCGFTETTKCTLANNTVEAITDRLPFNGNIDDVRLWNSGISNNDAADNYNRYLSGSEVGLIGYWPMDEGISTYAFDCSKTDKVFNENHITEIKKASSESVVPKKEQLAIKGVTDDNGNYIIRGIPFSGDGSTYSITPVMGTHKFEPKQQLRYVSASSLVHNGTDFTDKSSFPVKINIRYENTDYPVEGVSFYIDENPVSKENKLVVSDEKGQAEIDVPIGEHYIKATLTGHGFKNAGRYPGIGKIVVDENIQPIDFTDSTLVSVTGRVAGGLVENAKAVGFKAGKANIGPATIILKPAQYSNYSLNNTGASNTYRSLSNDDKAKIKSSSKIENGKSDVIIKTDPITGEYFVKLPPIKEWVVNSVSIKPNNVPGILDEKFYNKTIRTNPLMTSVDTMTIEKNKIDSFKYNVKQNFIYRVDPTINVSDVMAKPGAFGDSIYVVKNKLDKTKTENIKLYTLKNDLVKYRFGKSTTGATPFPNGKPIFTMGELYTFKIEGYEEYIDSTHVSTRVPLAGAAVSVDNEMGKLFKSPTAGAANDEIPKHEMQLNAKGYIYYRFQAGFPRLTSPEDGMSMVINVNYNNTLTPWKQNGSFRGIVMGYEPVAGANFKTRGPGPLMPLVVLRDPPGSSSYAYMEKGTSMTYSMSHKHTLEGSFDVENKMSFGVSVEYGVGLGFMVMGKVEQKNDLTVGLSGEYSSFTGKVKENTLSLKERVQTSASPDFVGSMADVYIGTSTNVFTTDCNILDIQINGNDTVIYNYPQEVSDLQAKTEFRLSQYEILTAQIPAWQKTAGGLLEEVPSYSGVINNDATKNRYVTTSKKDMVISTMNKDLYKVIPPAGKTVALGDQVDSAFFQVKNWQNLIKKNEMSKYNAKTSNVFEKSNISFDAGTSIERSYTFSTKSGTTSGDDSKTQESVKSEFGVEINDFGMDITLEEKFGGGRSNESTSTTENSTSFGYVLSDPDTDNRFSVNVYKNKFLSSELKDMDNEDLDAETADATVGSYMFELAAGQTSCPYEKADSTLFYKLKEGVKEPLLQLSVGSQALDVPKMDILPVKVRTDVPNGKEASFTLQLESGSTGYNPRAYVLSVDNSTNKDGAIISVDGTPLTTGRTFYITKGEPLIKTLSVRQSKLDVLNYENLKLRFSSLCNEVSDDKNITVKFVPSCSDLDLVIDSLTLNTETGNSLLLKLRNFNQDYTNFMGMKIQYKLEGEKNWSEKILARKNVNFGVIKPDTIIPELRSSMDYRLNFKGMDDGRYQVRAMTICSDPNSTTPINNITPEFIVVKDMVRPSSMGTPAPSSGILTPEDEIAVTFNEPLQTNRIVDTDFEVEGVLNGAVLQHAEGLALDGSSDSQAYTESTISLQNSSFAIEGWVQTGESTAMGNVFSIGEGADKLTLKMNKSSVALYVNDVQLGTAESITPKTDWQYVSLNYDSNNKQTSVYVLNSEENQTKLIKTLSSPINPAGRLLVGSGFTGKMHQVAVWNVNRTMTDLSDMNYAKSGAENNIIGYWPMDEANGKMAADKVRSRTMTVNSAWFVEPNGKSGVFDGIDKSVVINTTKIPLTSTDNFSLEFWFTGNTQSNTTIFSCGKGMGDLKPDEKLSVGFDNAGALSLFTKDVSYAIPNVTVLDGNWHHFALSVLRGGNSNVFIDGQQRLQIPSTKISGLASDKMTIGSRSYKPTESTFVQDQYFNGKIDEVRIWKTALISENIRLDMRSKLTNTTTGLIAYYPFEKEVNANGKLVEASLEDASPSNSGVGIAANMVYSDITPGIKMSRQKVKVNFNYTASDNKIVFTINEPLKRIENCVLEFTIKKVLDMNGNELTSPVKWIAYVNNNRLNWQTDQVVLTKQVLEPVSFKATIVNNSGKYENYVIGGLPGWLSVDKTSGKLNPLEKTEMTFTVDNATNIGSYETRVTLTGNNGIQEMLPVSLKVTGTRTDWSVNPYDYESSMNVIGQIKIEDVYQEDPEDILAAFNGTRCVGTAKPKFDKNKNCYVLYMDIYGNSSDNGQPLTFSLWDAGTGRIYPGVEVQGSPVIFVAASIVGTVTVPQIFNAADKVEQQLSLKQGWNWISSNVTSNTPTLMNQFKAGIETSGIQLKSRDGYIDYSNGTWVGNEFPINQTSMYMLKTNQSKTLKLVGAMAKPADLPVTIHPLWNWIGYVPQFVSPVKDALSGLTPTNGDQIKGQVGFASYSDGMWYGSLQYLMPGLGYMYKSMNSNAVSFKYPSQYLSQSKVMRQMTDVALMKWTVEENKYQMSMTVTGVVTIDKTELSNSDVQVGVFVGNECRGSATLKYVDSYQRYMAFLMIWGNLEDVNKKVSFKIYNPVNNQEVTIENSTVSFVPDNIVGTPGNPYNINSSVTGNENLSTEMLRVYPNPVVDVIHFDYDPASIEFVQIIDNLGCKVFTSTKISNNSINVSNLMPGAYILSVRYKGTTYMNRFIRK